MRVGRGINEDKKPYRKLHFIGSADFRLHGNMGWIWGVGSSDQAAGKIDTCCSRGGTIEPLRLSESKESVTGHGDMQETAGIATLRTFL